MKKKHFHHGLVQHWNSLPRGSVQVPLIGFLDTAGKSPKKPDLTSNPALSRVLTWKPQKVFSNVDNLNVLKN